MAHNDPYAGIEFDDITESTGLAADEIKCLKVSLERAGLLKVELWLTFSISRLVLISSTQRRLTSCPPMILVRS